MAEAELRGMMAEHGAPESYGEYVGSMLYIMHVGVYSIAAESFDSEADRDRWSPLRSLMEMGLVASEVKKGSGPALRGVECRYFTLTDKGHQMMEGIEREIGPKKYEDLVKAIYIV